MRATGYRFSSTKQCHRTEMWHLADHYLILEVGMVLSRAAVPSAVAAGQRRVIQSLVLDVLQTHREDIMLMGKPTMDEWKNQYYVKGDSFKLKCTLVDPPRGTQFKWTYPSTKAEHVVEQYSDGSHLRSILTAQNASESDTGNYTCSVSAPGYLPHNDSKHITIREKLAPFVNVTSVTKNLTVYEGQDIQWSADLLYYPDDPVIKYTDWRGDELVQDRITIRHKEEQSRSSLNITNIRSSDFGNYTVNVTTGGGAASDSVTFQLQVKSRPHMNLSSVPSYLEVGMSLNITCSAEGFPPANVTLQFQDCSSGNNSCSPPVTVHQTGKENTDIPTTGNIVDPGNIIEKNMAFSPHTPGLLWCIGENILGTENTSAAVRISDIGGMFVLRHRGENEKTVEVGEREKHVSVIENDYFSLMCGGSKLYYKTVILTHTLPDSSNPHTFPVTESNFSWKVNKTVDKAMKVLAGSYTCMAVLHEGQQISKRLTITVHGEEKVHFTNESNLRNQTVEVTKDAPFNLSCSVAGMPEPTIQWLKDGKVLNHTPEFFVEKIKESSSNSRELLIFRIMLERHAGVYTCVAKNRVNEVTGSLTISVAGVSKGVRVELTISLVAIALLVLMVGVLLTIMKREIDSKTEFNVMKDHLLKDNIGQLNPNYTAEQQAELLPYDESRWEVPRRNITPGKQLGSGAFGKVIKATVTGLEGRATTTVAIKMCKRCESRQLEAFIMELKIMIHLGKHLNIVNLMGASTVQGELWILVEYCRFGDLLHFMHRHRNKFIDQIDGTTGKIDFKRTAKEPSSPLPHSFHTSHVQAPVDMERHVISSSPQFVLSAPPPGHCAKSVHPSTVSSDNSSAAESTSPCLPDINHAQNPLYCMGVSTSTAGPEEGIEGHEGFHRSLTLQSRDSRHLTPGTDTLLNTTSDSSQLWSLGTNTTNLTRQTSSPLSPTDSCFMSEAHSDSKGNAFTYGVGSVPGFNAPFSTHDLLSWGWQVAHGMAYLSKRNILHGDLAARNLLLADNNVVKISDFGLSRDIYKDNIYKKKKDDLMPIKWMSVEGIRDRIFSEQSDVWAFGITLWEIFSLGGAPYPNIDCIDLLRHLEDGHRMGCPKYANDDIHTVMMECWRTEPMERPPFSQLVDILGLMMPSSLKEDYLVMNDVYIQMNEERFKNEPDYLTMMANPTFENLTKAEELDDPPHKDDQVGQA
ncbi:vascular endothelial growth factor receptor 1-like isoform X2 [Eriocheir sinensis]|uniref:vascular endothelial growth factor receptor 1-like isoform X2 n=1 Tax=Eriocheir sinensis TaxID=95602 RepID=UPI0021C6F262|nr:vascular endothelial growth factor receptor 1-like isoform X2 [Eriocheir sinensis]